MLFNAQKNIITQIHYILYESTRNLFPSCIFEMGTLMPIENNYEMLQKANVQTWFKPVFLHLHMDGMIYNTHLFQYSTHSSLVPVEANCRQG